MLTAPPLGGLGGQYSLLKIKLARARAFRACAENFPKNKQAGLPAMQRLLRAMAVNNDSYGKVETIAVLPVVSVGLQLFSVVVETVLSLTTFVNVMNCEMIDYYLQTLR